MGARAASIVLLGVCFSVVDLLGLMHFLDINLNTVSVITLALAIGLTIDFSAHIGLLFVTSVGSKKERVTRALSFRPCSDSQRFHDNNCNKHSGWCEELCLPSDVQNVCPHHLAGYVSWHACCASSVIFDRT